MNKDIKAVRSEDLLDTGTCSVPKGEPLAVLVLDVHVDGGDWGDGRLPKELEKKEVWLGLLSRLNPGGRMVVNLGSTTQGVEAFVGALMNARDAADELAMEVWGTIYANVPKKDVSEMRDGNLMLLFGPLPLERWQAICTRHLQRLGGQESGTLHGPQRAGVKSAEWFDLHGLLEEKTPRVRF
eukprot:s2710_g5.t1